MEKKGIEVKNYCHLSEKAEEEQKAAKEVALLFNALTVVHRCLEIKPSGLLDGFHLLSLN
jgi:hypothetical protein